MKVYTLYLYDNHAGTAQTATGNGTAFSSSGNPAALAPALGLLNSIGRRMQQTPIGNTAASFNPSGPNNCTEQRLTPNGMGGGAFSQVRCHDCAQHCPCHFLRQIISSK